MSGPDKFEEHYVITEPGKEPREVSVIEWMQAEVRAGFFSKVPGTPATGGFSDSLSGIKGTVAYTEEQLKKVLTGLDEEGKEDGK